MGTAVATEEVSKAETEAEAAEAELEAGEALEGKAASKVAGEEEEITSHKDSR